MQTVVIESPLSGNFERNIKFARLCALDCLNRGEAPYASHLFFTQMLDDEDEKQRRQGMEAGFVWASKADKVAVYMNFGMSKGMIEGIEKARDRGQNIEYRTLPKELMDRLQDADDLATKAAV